MSTSNTNEKREKAQTILKFNNAGILIGFELPKEKPIALSIIQLAAENGWFPWHEGTDHSNLRLVSRAMKASVDATFRGGPDFSAIIGFLNKRNNMNEHCKRCNFYEAVSSGVRSQYYFEGYQSDTWLDCRPILLERDPRMSRSEPFDSLDLRERAKRLLTFHRRCISNFLAYYDDEVDLLNIEMNAPSDCLLKELREYNPTIYDFILRASLFLRALAELTSDPDDKNYLNYPSFYPNLFLSGDLCVSQPERQFRFFYILQAILHIFLSSQPFDEEEATICLLPDYFRSQVRVSISQIQNIPKTFCEFLLRHFIDIEAMKLLGVEISGSIDIYRDLFQEIRHYKESLFTIGWMPCLGGSPENFEPLKCELNNFLRRYFP